MHGLPEWLTFLLVLTGLILLARGVARWVGLGRCLACRAPCAYFDAYCWAHHPDNPRNDPGR